MGSFGYLAQGPTPVQYYQDLASKTALADQERQASQQQQRQAAVTGPQEQQMNALKIQQAQQAQQSQQAIQKAWQENNGVVNDQMIQSAAKYGAQPSDLTALQQHQATMQKNMQDLDTATLAAHSAHADVAAGHINSLLQQPDQVAAQQYPQLIQGLMKEHDINPDDLQKAGLDPATYPGKQALQTFLLGLNGYKSQVATEQKNREVAAQELRAQSDAQSSGATVAEKQTETTQKQRALDAAQLTIAAQQGPAALQTALEALPYGRAKVFEGVTDPKQLQRLGMTPEEQVKADQTAALQAQTGAHQKVEESQGAQRIGIERQREAREAAQAGTNIGPGGVSPAAQMAADGRMDPQTLRSQLRKNPGLINQISQVDPKFDEANIDKRYNTLRDFTNTSNTKAGGQSIALNTLVHHADLYIDTADAIKNGNFTPGNAAYNAVSQMMGSPAPGNLNLVARFLAGETAKVAQGGVPAEGEINGILKSLGQNASPDQMKQAGQMLLGIAAGRMIPLQETVKDAKLDNVIHVLKPDAQAILQKRGYDPNTMKPMAQAGGGASSGGGFKAGDKRQVNGKTYVRDDKGAWTAQ